MKKKVSKLTDLKFSLSSANKAVVTATGEVQTLGWSNPELGNDRIGDGILHMDFLADPPANQAGEQVSSISAQRSFPLLEQPQGITVHSETNELSVTLPAVGNGV